MREVQITLATKVAPTDSGLFPHCSHGSTKNGTVAKDDTARTAIAQDPKIPADPIKAQL